MENPFEQIKLIVRAHQGKSDEALLDIASALAYGVFFGIHLERERDGAVA